MSRKGPEVGIRVRRTKATGHGYYVASKQVGGKRVEKTFAFRPGRELDETDPVARSAAIAWRAARDLDAAAGKLGIPMDATPITIRELVSKFLTSRAPHWKPGTRDYYRNTLQGNLEDDSGGSPLMRRWGDRIAGGMRGPEIQEWLDGELAAGKLPRTINTYRQSLSTLFLWAERMELVSRNPMAKVQGARENKNKPPPRALRLHELQAFLRHAGEHRLFWLFLALTGLRRSEAFRLRWDWLDLEGGILKVKEGKTGYHELPLAQVLVDEFSRLTRAAHGFVFSDDGEVRQFRVSMKNSFETAKIDDEGVAYHTFRHTYITMIEQLPGVRYSTVKRLARHASTEMTLRYLHHQEDDMRRAMKLLEEQVTTAVVAKRSVNGSR